MPKQDTIFNPLPTFLSHVALVLYNRFNKTFLMLVKLSTFEKKIEFSTVFKGEFRNYNFQKTYIFKLYNVTTFRIKQSTFLTKEFES